MSAALAIAPQVGLAAACTALDVARATLYRHRQPRAPRSRRASSRALGEDERAQVRELLYSERFRDASPRQVYAALLDEGVYVASVATMYRVLRDDDAVHERRRVVNHPAWPKPELVARGPNEVWSWDITKLKGPTKGVFFALYVVLDIYSRYVVGWLLAQSETAGLAERLLAETIEKEGVARDHLTIHSDRGAPMKSRTVAEMLADLGVDRSLSRPKTSNDNPFSEAQFRTVKYCPDFPKRFGSMEDARGFCQPFFRWYNEEHHHSGIALLTPSSVHHGIAEATLVQRQAVLQKAYEAHPERFIKGPPVVSRPPAEVWINPPPATASAIAASGNSDG
ncbi:MAG: IS3 family transposase [Alphaproteobacteria bacterium]|nr:IS3 family transposase [Alphaproteobacteria bacterium]MCB9686173.1 IS3 family transposase [Alphaproteobacteria bacterium]